MRQWIYDAAEAEDAVRKDGMALGDVPEGMRTPELCEMAVKRTPEAIRFVPDRLLEAGLCRFEAEDDDRGPRP